MCLCRYLPEGQQYAVMSAVAIHVCPLGQHTWLRLTLLPASQATGAISGQLPPVPSSASGHPPIKFALGTMDWTAGTAIRNATIGVAIKESRSRGETMVNPMALGFFQLTSKPRQDQETEVKTKHGCDGYMHPFGGKGAMASHSGLLFKWKITLQLRRRIEGSIHREVAAFGDFRHWACLSRTPFDGTRQIPWRIRMHRYRTWMNDEGAPVYHLAISMIKAKYPIKGIYPACSGHCHVGIGIQVQFQEANPALYYRSIGLEVDP